MEAALVSAATGALKPVLGKLADLLGDEYRRFRGVRDEIPFLTHELTAMEAFLLQKSMEDDPGVQDKLWMKEVRELSYDIEDSLDDFMENARGKSAKPDGFIQKIKNLLDTTKDRRQIAKAIEDLKKQVKEASDRHQRYAASQATSKVNNITVDPRALAIFEDVSNLIGIDGPKEELIRWFDQETRGESTHQHRPKMISIVGFGGLGKTTLACQVYNELRDQFDCHAFVSVSRNPNMKKVLETILNQVSLQVSSRDYPSDEDIQQLMTRISNFLAAKRYFIVVDDIWNVDIWETIKFAFPFNVYDCRIITTTRVNDVAQSCCSFGGHIHIMKPLSEVHSWQLFHKRLFNSGECPSYLKEVSSQILKKCAGLPLAITAISGLLANKEKTKYQWHQVESSIGRGLERNASIEGMIKIISLSFFDLPHHIKTCLLYLSIFPEDFVVEKEILIRRWIAEGFIQEKNGYTLYEAGEIIFNELLNRSLIQPDFVRQVFDEVTGCRVHDMVLDFIVSKSVEENFVTIIGIPGINPKPANKVRRLSLQNNGILPSDLILSSVRSLNIFENDAIFPSLLKFKHLRVLCFEGFVLEDCDRFAAIGNLPHLKCLTFRAEMIKFPKEIAKLRNLETLDIKGYPNEKSYVTATISVDERLVHFFPRSFNIPDEFEGMNSLEVLGRITVENRSSDFFRRLGHLTNLRKLALYVRSYETQRDMACSIRKLAQANLRSLRIFFEIAPKSLEFLEELNLSGQCSLQELCLEGTPFRKVPRWMGSLVNLQKLSLSLSTDCHGEGVEILGGLPNLRYVRVIAYGYGSTNQIFMAKMERVMEAHPNHPVYVWEDRMVLSSLREFLSC